MNRRKAEGGRMKAEGGRMNRLEAVGRRLMTEY